MAVLQVGRRAARIYRKSVRTTTSHIEHLESRRLLSGEAAVAQISLTSTTGTAANPVYHYDIKLTNTGSDNIGTFWFAWTLQGDFLPTRPLTANGPTGWNSAIMGTGTSFDGGSVQWVAPNFSDRLAPTHSLDGFTFTSADSPTALAGKVHNTTTPILTSFVYNAFPLGDPGFQFVVTQAASTPTASKLAIASQPTTGIAGQPLTTALKVNVELPSSAIVTSNTSQVQLSIASGPGGFAIGSTTSVKAVNGVATFSNLKFNVAGTYTLKATDGALTPAVTKIITIAPAAPAKLDFALNPATGIAGKVLTPAVVVKVEDTFGNVEIGDSTSTVTLSRTAGPFGGSVAGTLSMKAVKGIATFSNISMQVAGPYTLKATDGALATASKSITIAPAAPTKLVITQQATFAVAGVKLSPSLVVKVEDAFGNVATNNSSTVTLSRVSGPTGGTLIGTLAVVASKGIATFSNLSMKIAGSYVLKATDGLLTAATSKKITISNAAAAKLAITQQPTTGKSGVALGTLVVKVEDAFGNVALGNTSSIAMFIETTTAIGGGTFTGTRVLHAVNGVASFTNLVLQPAGTYTLRAIDGSLAAAVSKAIAVS